MHGGKIEARDSDEQPIDLVASVMDWESGEMGEDEAVRFFQYLVDTGMAWTLQGAYGRQAMAYIEAGLVKATVG